MWLYFLRKSYLGEGYLGFWVTKSISVIPVPFKKVGWVPTFRDKVECLVGLFHWLISIFISSENYKKRKKEKRSLFPVCPHSCCTEENHELPAQRWHRWWKCEEVTVMVLNLISGIYAVISLDQVFDFFLKTKEDVLFYGCKEKRLNAKPQDSVLFSKNNTCKCSWFT